MAKAASSSSAAKPPIAPSFESALAELDSLVKTLEGGRIPLEDSLTAYQRGMELLRYCQEALSSAEQKIQVLENDTLRDFTPASEE